MSRSALDIFKKIFPYLYLKQRTQDSVVRTLWALVYHQHPMESSWRAPHVGGKTRTVYYRGRVSVFKKDNTVSYGTIPCEDGKLKNEFNFDLGKCATLAPSII